MTDLTKYSDEMVAVLQTSERATWDGFPFSEKMQPRNSIGKASLSKQPFISLMHARYVRFGDLIHGSRIPPNQKAIAVLGLPIKLRYSENVTSLFR